MPFVEPGQPSELTEATRALFRETYDADATVGRPGARAGST